MSFYRVSLGFTGLDWVWLVFIELYWVLMSFYRVSLGLTSFDWV